MRRIVLGLTALALVASAVSGCSGGSSQRSSDKPGEPSPSMTAITVPCARFAGVAQRIADAQAELYRSHDRAAMDTLLSELSSLEHGAPAAVQAALKELVTGFRSAQELLTHPTQEGSQKLEQLAPALAKDGQTVTAYVTSKCH